VHLGLNLVRVRPDHMPDLAAHAETLGYESVFVPDHVVLPVSFASKYPGTPDGSFPYPGDIALYDPWIVLATIARATSTIRLGTAVYLLALRHPIVTARHVVTLDALSGGRVVVGVGVGWLTEEYEALGLDPRTRFSRTEEAAVAVRRLWTEPAVAFTGRHFTFGPVHLEPRPPVPPPLLFGGDSDGARRRAVRFGDGWMSGGVSDVDDIADLVAGVRARRAALCASGDAHLGLDEPFDLTILHPNPSAADLAALAALGVSRVVVMPWTRNRDAPEAIERFRALAADVVDLT
jgi:probable F420-dependent oxidoreductase